MLKQGQKYYLGCKVDLGDHRDKYLEETFTGILPPSVDLRPFCPPIYDQGKLGSCTANAIAAHLDFNRKKQGEEFITPSRLFIYYNERLMENTVETDAGASIRDSVKEVVKYGAPPESLWTYTTQKFKWRPSKEAYADAIQYEALKYYRLKRDELDMKTCLANGYPFVCGVSVYQSFQDSNGDVPMPGNEQLLGGHAILIVGYENDRWIFRNSWGEGWGHSGYGSLPKDYLLGVLCNDAWSLRQVK